MPSIARDDFRSGAGAAPGGSSRAGLNFPLDARSRAARPKGADSDGQMNFLTHATFYAMLMLAAWAGLWGQQR